MTRQDKLYKIAINYGYEAQSRQCIKEHAIEELADVYIMVWQMIILLGAKNIDKIVDVKLDRQIARIEHE